MTRLERSALVAPLQWIAGAVILASGVVRISVGRFSSGLIGWLLLVWAAHTARTACVGRWTRARWIAVSAVAVSVAVLSLTLPPTQGWKAFGDVVVSLSFVTVVVALAGTAAEYELSSARRWQVLSRLAWPAMVSFALVSILPWRTGVASLQYSDGLTTGEVRVTTPTWASVVMIVGSVPLLVVGGFAIFAFVRTYREADAPSPDSRGSQDAITGGP